MFPCRYLFRRNSEDFTKLNLCQLHFPAQRENVLRSGKQRCLHVAGFVQNWKRQWRKRVAGTGFDMRFAPDEQDRKIPDGCTQIGKLGTFSPDQSGNLISNGNLLLRIRPVTTMFQAICPSRQTIRRPIKSGPLESSMYSGMTDSQSFSRATERRTERACSL